MPPFDDKTPAEKAVAAEKAAVSKTAATEGATSVAEAVKRVADAAVAEVQKSAIVPAQDFLFAGSVGGRFTVRGKGFSTNGTVKVNGHQAVTTEWGDAFIDGRVPDAVKAGTVTVEVAVDRDTVKKGVFKI
jgi:membrane protein involved in colicin uptake